MSARAWGSSFASELQSGPGLGVPSHPFGDGPPMLVESRAPHEEPEVSGIDEFTRNVLGRSRYQLGEGTDLLRRRRTLLKPSEMPVFGYARWPYFSRSRAALV
jgi:hypothetical protein